MVTGHQFGRGIFRRLIEMHSKRRHRCLVTEECLHELAAAHGLPEDDVIGTYGKFWKVIQGAALDKFGGGNHTPVIRERDVL